MPVSVNQVNAPQSAQSKVSFAVQSSNSANTSVGGHKVVLVTPIILLFNQQ